MSNPHPTRTPLREAPPVEIETDAETEAESLPDTKEGDAIYASIYGDGVEDEVAIPPKIDSEPEEEEEEKKPVLEAIHSDEKSAAPSIPAKKADGKKKKKRKRHILGEVAHKTEKHIRFPLHFMYRDWEELIKRYRKAYQAELKESEGVTGPMFVLKVMSNIVMQLMNRRVEAKGYLVKRKEQKRADEMADIQYKQKTEDYREELKKDPKTPLPAPLDMHTGFLIPPGKAVILNPKDEWDPSRGDSKEAKADEPPSDALCMHIATVHELIVVQKMEKDPTSEKPWHPKVVKAAEDWQKILDKDTLYTEVEKDMVDRMGRMRPEEMCTNYIITRSMMETGKVDDPYLRQWMSYLEKEGEHDFRHTMIIVTCVTPDVRKYEKNIKTKDGKMKKCTMTMMPKPSQLWFPISETKLTIVNLHAVMKKSFVGYPMDADHFAPFEVNGPTDAELEKLGVVAPEVEQKRAQEAKIKEEVEKGKEKEKTKEETNTHAVAGSDVSSSEKEEPFLTDSIPRVYGKSHPANQPLPPVNAQAQQQYLRQKSLYNPDFQFAWLLESCRGHEKNDLFTIFVQESSLGIVDKLMGRWRLKRTDLKYTKSKITLGPFIPQHQAPLLYTLHRCQKVGEALRHGQPIPAEQEGDEHQFINLMSQMCGEVARNGNHMAINMILCVFTPMNELHPEQQSVNRLVHDLEIVPKWTQERHDFREAEAKKANVPFEEWNRQQEEKEAKTLEDIAKRREERAKAKQEREAYVKEHPNPPLEWIEKIDKEVLLEQEDEILDREKEQKIHTDNNVPVLDQEVLSEALLLEFCPAYPTMYIKAIMRLRLDHPVTHNDPSRWYHIFSTLHKFGQRWCIPSMDWDYSPDAPPKELEFVDNWFKLPAVEVLGKEIPEQMKEYYEKTGDTIPKIKMHFQVYDVPLPTTDPDKIEKRQILEQRLKDLMERNQPNERPLLDQTQMAILELITSKEAEIPVAISLMRTHPVPTGHKRIVRLFFDSGKLVR